MGVTSNNNYICFKCHTISRADGRCRVCGRTLTCMGNRLRAPSKNKKHRWKKFLEYISKRSPFLFGSGFGNAVDNMKEMEARRTGDAVDYARQQAESERQHTRKVLRKKTHLDKAAELINKTHA